MCIIGWIGDLRTRRRWSIIGNPLPKTSGLAKTRAISMSKVASLFKWPFMTRLLGLGHDAAAPPSPNPVSDRNLCPDVHMASFSVSFQTITPHVTLIWIYKMTLLSSIRPRERSKVASGARPVIARLSIGQAFERPLGRSSRGSPPARRSSHRVQDQESR
jgi:hypothetical protein